MTLRSVSDYAGLQAAVTGSSPGDIIECAAGDYHIAAGANTSSDWGDLTNSGGTAGFVWADTLAGWVNPIIIRPASGAEGKVRFGCMRKNGNWPVIFDGIAFHDENSAQTFTQTDTGSPRYGLQDWDNSWSLLYDNGGVKQIGVRNCAFSGKLTSTDGLACPKGVNGNGVVVEDTIFIMTGECINGNGACRLRRLEFFKPWQQACQIGSPDQLVFEDIYLHHTLLAVGSHGDLIHIIIPQSPSGATYTVASCKNLFCAQEGGAPTQGFFVQDFSSGSSSVDFQGSSIKNYAYVGVSQAAFDLTSVKNLVIELCTLQTDMAASPTTEQPKVILTNNCQNITIRRNVYNADPVVNNSTNVTIATNNVVIDRAAGSGQAAVFPSIANASTAATLALFKAAITPGALTVAKQLDGTFAGALFSDGSLNDGSIFGGIVIPPLTPTPTGTSHCSPRGFIHRGRR